MINIAELPDKKYRTLKKTICVVACQLILPFFTSIVISQKVQYSRENVFANNPDDLQLISNVGDSHHMLCLKSGGEPEIFIFDEELKFKLKVRIPYKLPEKGDVRVISFNSFYYLFIHLPSGNEYVVFKITDKGIIVDISRSFQKLLLETNVNSRFQLVENQQKLYLLYQTAVKNLPKNSILILQTDSLLNFEFAHKVIYDFKKGEEVLQQLTLIDGKYLFLIKTSQESTLLELVKIELATGITFRREFESSGHVFSETTFTYNNKDSALTVASLLSEPGEKFDEKKNIFLCQLTSTLNEQVPYSILKSRFKNDISANFLLVEGGAKWLRFNSKLFMYSLFVGNAEASFPISVNGFVENYHPDVDYGISFSLLNKNFEIKKDSLVANKKNANTIFSNHLASFVFGNNTYLFLDQLYSNRHKGLLMINSSDSNQLVFTDVRVNGRNRYLLSKSRAISDNTILIPYTNKREAGLIKISVE